MKLSALFSFLLASVFSFTTANAAIGWSEAITAGSTTPKAAHINELRTQIQKLRTDMDSGAGASVPVHSGSNFINGTLVTTDIPANVTNGASFVIEISGKSYSSANAPFKAIAQGYLYNNQIISYSGASYGGDMGANMKIFEDGGVLKFWWPRVSYWNSFNVHVRDAGGSPINHVTSITDTAEPVGTKKVTVTWQKAVLANTAGNVGIGTSAPAHKLDVTGSARISDKLYTSNIGRGAYGIYNPLRYQHVWSMGDAYNLPADGLDETGAAGNLYGLAWSYNPDYSYAGSNPQSKPGLTHQLLLMINGITKTAIGDGLWTSGNITLGGTRALHFGSADQRIYGDDSSAFYADSNNSTNTQMLFRDKEDTVYGRVYGDGNGASFGLLDGDGAWGIQMAKDNYTRFLINSSEKMRITSAGNVGIGTTTPKSKLQLSSTDATNAWATIGTGVNSYTPLANELSIYNDGLATDGSYAGIFFKAGQTTSGGQINTARIGAVRNGPYEADLVFATRDSAGAMAERMRIQNGNIGIGTTAPVDRLHVSGPNTAPNLGAASVVDATAVFSNSDTAYGTYLATLGNGMGLIQQRRDSVATYYGLALNPYGGNVGIGTTTPARKLDVNGSAKISAGGDYSFLNMGSEVQDKLYADNTAAKSYGGGLWFRVQNAAGTGYSDLLRLAETGNVGIGKNPSAKLDVDGTIRAFELCDETGANCSDLSAGLGGAGFSQIFASPGTFTFTVPAGVTKLMFEVAGAGGGGGIGGRYAQRVGEPGGQSSVTGNGQNIIAYGGSGGNPSMIGPGNSKIHTSGTGGDVSLAGKGAPGGMGGSSLWHTSGTFNVLYDGHVGNPGGLTYKTVSVTPGQIYTLTVGAGGVAHNEIGYLNFNASYPSGNAAPGADGYIKVSAATGSLTVVAGNGASNSLWALNGTDLSYVSGNVGIGTTTPAHKLDVNGNMRTSGRNVYFGSADQRIYGDDGSAFYADSNHSTVTQMIFRDKEDAVYGRVYGDSNGANFGLLDGNGAWGMQLAKDNYTRFLINNSEKMRILANGNVGIGTTAPSQKLDVNGSAKISAGGDYSFLNMGSEVNDKLYADNTAAKSYGGGLWFRVQDAAGTGYSDLLRLAETGNVGIGKNPSAKLDVNGTIRAFELCDETGANCSDLSAGLGGGNVTVSSLKLCGENSNCTGTVKLCSGISPDSTSFVNPNSYPVTYGSWSNSQCGTSGTGWHVAGYSSCGTGIGTANAKCEWVLVEDLAGGATGGSLWGLNGNDLSYTTGSVGIGTTALSPGLKLDIEGKMGATEYCDQNGNNCVKTSKVLTGDMNTSIVTAGNWYRIASNPGNRAHARFVLDTTAFPDGDSTLVFEAGTNYNAPNGISFTVLSHSMNTIPTFTKARILRKSIYDPQYLEVYLNSSGAVKYNMLDNFQTSGWTPLDWTAGAIPSGYTAHEYDTNNLFVVGASDDAFTIARNRSVGIGTTTPSTGLKLDVEGKIGATEYCDQNGANCTAAAALGGSNTGFSQIFASPGTFTFTVPTGVTQVVFEVAGAGGGGGGTSSNSGDGGQSSVTGNGQNIIAYGGAGGIGSYGDTNLTTNRNGKAHTSGSGGDISLAGKGAPGGMGATSEYQTSQYDLHMDGHTGNPGGLTYKTLSVTPGQTYTVTIGSGGTGGTGGGNQGYPGAGANGADGYVKVSAATGSVAVSNGVGTSLGEGQQWYDVSSARTIGTSYQNTYGRPIQVCLYTAGSDQKVQVSTNNASWVSVAQIGSAGAYSNGACMIVPTNHYYRIAPGGVAPTNYIWSELR